LGVAAVGFDLSKRVHVGKSGNWVRFAICTRRARFKLVMA
jgi:hypothetical protein